MAKKRDGFLKVTYEADRNFLPGAFLERTRPLAPWMKDRNLLPKKPPQRPVKPS